MLPENNREEMGREECEQDTLYKIPKELTIA